MELVTYRPCGGSRDGAMRRALGCLVEHFPANPLQARKAMLDLLANDVPAFQQAALALFRSSEDGPGLNFLAVLLFSRNLLMTLLVDPSAAPLEDALVLARRAAPVVPLLDVQLMRHLSMALAQENPDDRRVRRLLEVAGAVTDVSRIAAMLQHLQESGNPVVRSKVALLLGRKFRDTGRASQDLRNEDPRVRANAVEALWGAETAEFVELFRMAARDPHQRVAANAWLGLYFAGDTQAIGGLVGMAESESLMFRAAAYWAMGRTGDPRFLGVLRRARGTARTLEAARVHLVQRHVVVKTRPALEILLRGSREWLPAGSEGRGTDAKPSRVLLSVGNGAGEPVTRLAPLDFSLVAEGIPISGYSVREIEPREPLLVGSVLPRNPAFAGWLGEALEAATAHRKGAGLAVVEGLEAERERAGGGSETSVLAAAHAMGAALGQQPGLRHLILTAGFDSDAEVPTLGGIRLLAEVLGTVQVTVAAVVADRAPAPLLSVLRELSARTSGWCVSAVRERDVRRVFGQVAWAIVHQYEIQWEATGAETLPVIEIITENGYGRVNISDAMMI